MTPDNVAAFLDQEVQRQHEAPALIIPHSDNPEHRDVDRVSFGELRARSLRAARTMTANGITRGTRTLIMIPPGLDLIATVYGCFRIGAVPVFIDPGMGIQRMCECIARTQPHALVGIQKAVFLSRVFGRTFHSLRIRLTTTMYPSLVGGSPLWRWAEDTKEDAIMKDDDPAAILFTSGSTGSPKGVLMRHRHFVAQIRMLKENFNIQPGTLDLPLLPVFSLFNPSLGMGSVIPLIDASKPITLSPAHVVDLVERFRVGHSFGAPVLWAKVFSHLKATGRRLNSLQQLLMAGAPVPPSLIEEAKGLTPHAVVRTPYGATEGLPITLIDGHEILQCREQSESGAGNCVGRPLPDNEVRIVEPQGQSLNDFNALPANKVGEIIVSGPTVTDSYDALPEATREAKVVIDGTTWHRMGDLGYLDETGRLWFCGRKVHRVVSGDRTLHSVCVEAIFNAHPKVHRSALIGMGEPGQQMPAVVVELKEPSAPPNLKQELLTLAHSQAHTRNIDTFFTHPSFPVDVRHNAKIHRNELAQWALGRKPI